MNEGKQFEGAIEATSERQKELESAIQWLEVQILEERRAIDLLSNPLDENSSEIKSERIKQINATAISSRREILSVYERELKNVQAELAKVTSV